MQRLEEQTDIWRSQEGDWYPVHLASVEDMEADPPGVAQLPEPVQPAQQVPVQVQNAQQQQTVPVDPQAGNPPASVSKRVTAGTDANVAA